MPKNYDIIRDKCRFKAISEKGTKIVSRSFVLLYLKRSESIDFENDKPALGTAVSKKMYKLAVHRNKGKRRIRALLNECSKKFDLCGYDLFFIGRRGIVERNFEDLESEFIKAFRKLK